MKTIREFGSTKKIFEGFAAAAALLLFLMPARAAESKNHFGLELALGQHQTAPLVTDLETHHRAAAADFSSGPRSFTTKSHITYGIGGIWERDLAKNSRLGFRFGVDALNIGRLSEHYSPVGRRDNWETRTLTYRVTGSQRYVSVYYRHLFRGPISLCPIVGGGISNMRIKPRIDESDNWSPFIGSGDNFGERYRRPDKWIPHALVGMDFMIGRGANVGLGIVGEYFFDAKFSGFRDGGEELRMVNDRLASVPVDSADGRPFEADLSGFLVKVALKILL